MSRINCWHAAVSTLAALRSIVHALRGWPTPVGAALNTSERIFDDAGACSDPRALEHVTMAARQVVEFARHYRQTAG